MKKIWTFFRSFLILIGFCVVALAVFGALGLQKANPPLPERMVLSYTFYGTPPDAPDMSSWIAQFVAPAPTLSDVTSAIYQGAQDKRVEALAVRLAAGDYNWADVQELRAAVLAFKATGKPSYIYAESYGEVHSGMAEYYLATAFGEIWMQPIGAVSITGFHAEMPYFKKLLDVVGVSPDIIQKGDYKTAPESALLEHMSKAQRETVHGILASMMTDFFDGVVQGRKIAADQIGPLVDAAPYTALEAKERNLVDTVGYADELMAKILPDDTLKLVDAVAYYYSADLFKKERQAIEKSEIINDVAVVYVGGMIVSGTGGVDGLMGGQDMAYADDIADAILSAAEDKSVGAIVLRVASPGGSPSASETIRRAVEVAKTKGKYVVVSMGSEAASGGYWVSVDADRIFAQTGTITGSIGVFGGKASFAKLWERLGVNWDGVQFGENASLWTINRPYDEAQKATVSRMLDDIYDAFIDRVANGRHFGRDVVENMAQGRVWMGRQAKEHGLIDEIGGLREALQHVAVKLGAGSADHLDVYSLPQITDPVEEIKSILLGGVSAYTGIGPLLRELALIQAPIRGITYAESFAIRH